MAISNYTYLKIKMPSPHGVITIGGDLQQAHLCERENYDIVIAACQPPEPRLAWVATTGITPELGFEGQPPRAGPKRDPPTW